MAGVYVLSRAEADLAGGGPFRRAPGGRRREGLDPAGESTKSMNGRRSRRSSPSAARRSRKRRAGAGRLRLRRASGAEPRVRLLLRLVPGPEVFRRDQVGRLRHRLDEAVAREEADEPAPVEDVHLQPQVSTENALVSHVQGPLRVPAGCRPAQRLTEPAGWGAGLPRPRPRGRRTWPLRLPRPSRLVQVGAGLIEGGLMSGPVVFRRSRRRSRSPAAGPPRRAS